MGWLWDHKHDPLLSWGQFVGLVTQNWLSSLYNRVRKRCDLLSSVLEGATGTALRRRSMPSAPKRHLGTAPTRSSLDVTQTPSPSCCCVEPRRGHCNLHDGTLTATKVHEFETGSSTAKKFHRFEEGTSTTKMGFSLKDGASTAERGRVE